MVNEVYEVSRYLEGEDIVASNLYRICYLIVCHYKSRGMKRIEIREALFNWGKQNGIDIRYNVNNIINRVFDTDKTILLKAPIVKVNKQDIAEIKKRFDDGKTRLVALAILCYAKAHGNGSGEFNMSSVGLGAWLGINRKTLRNRFIRELIEYEYLLEVAKPLNNMHWEKAYDVQSTQYKINALLHNSGNYTLVDNDVGRLYSEIFNN